MMQTETLLNDKVTRGLRAQFSAERVQAIIAQAQAMFQESTCRSGNKQPTPAEPYKLFESGWIDQALEYLGSGRWAIGRPKLVRSSAEPLRHIRRGTVQLTHIVSNNPIEPVALVDGIELFMRHIPGPSDLRYPPNIWSNAIEYRNFVVVG
jgi:hypothetical protein